MKYFNALCLKGKTLDNITKKTTKGPSQIFSHWSWRLWLSPWPSFPFPPCPWAFVSPLQTLVCSGVVPKSWAASESQPKVWPVEYCNHRVFLYISEIIQDIQDWFKRWCSYIYILLYYLPPYVNVLITYIYIWYTLFSVEQHTLTCTKISTNLATWPESNRGHFWV